MGNWLLWELSWWIPFSIYLYLLDGLVCLSSPEIFSPHLPNTVLNSFMILSVSLLGTKVDLFLLFLFVFMIICRYIYYMIYYLMMNMIMTRFIYYLYIYLSCSCIMWDCFTMLLLLLVVVCCCLLFLLVASVAPQMKVLIN